MKEFNAILKKVEGKNASYIEIPFNVQEVFGANRVKVKASFDGVLYRGSIVKMGTDCHIIGVTKEIRDKIKKTFGDTIKVTIERDEEERVVEVPEDFELELHKNKKALEFWNTLSFSVQKKFVQSIISAKKEETIIKRIEKSILKLSNNEKI